MTREISATERERFLAWARRHDPGDQPEPPVVGRVAEFARTATRNLPRCHYCGCRICAGVVCEGCADLALLDPEANTDLLFTSPTVETEAAA